MANGPDPPSPRPPAITTFASSSFGPLAASAWRSTTVGNRPGRRDGVDRDDLGRAAARLRGERLRADQHEPRFGPGEIDLDDLRAAEDLGAGSRRALDVGRVGHEGRAGERPAGARRHRAPSYVPRNRINEGVCVPISACSVCAAGRPAGRRTAGRRSRRRWPHRARRARPPRRSRRARARPRRRRRRAPAPSSAARARWGAAPSARDLRVDPGRAHQITFASARRSAIRATASSPVTISPPAFGGRVGHGGHGLRSRPDRVDAEVGGAHACRPAWTSRP